MITVQNPDYPDYPDYPDRGAFVSTGIPDWDQP